MLTAAECGNCRARFFTGPSDRPAAAVRRHYTGFGQRLFIATLPAAVLALFVESTLYGYILYLGVYLTYLAWGEATAEQSEDPQPAANP